MQQLIVAANIQEKAGALYFTIRQHMDLSSINLHTTITVAAVMQQLIVAANI